MSPNLCRKDKNRPAIHCEIVTVNCRSFNNKYDFIVDPILENNFDIVSMTKTWLSTNDVQNRRVMSEFEKHGYYFHHRPRGFGRGGGVA